jgi:quercetin dioxygenase-like cupin family protein
MPKEETPAGNGDVSMFEMHMRRLRWLEQKSDHIVALPCEYPDGYRVPEHDHDRAQLLHALHGVVLIKTKFGRWIVPPDHAMWVPAGIVHSVEMLGDVSMRSVYVLPDAIEGLPSRLRVVAVSDLMRSLIIEAVQKPAQSAPSERRILLLNLLLLEIPRLPERPLGLTFPSDPRIAALCRRFLAEPSPHTTIDDWAELLGMSRRSFTRRRCCLRPCRGWPMESRSPVWRWTSAMTACRLSPPCSSACWVRRRATICADPSRRSGRCGRNWSSERMQATRCRRSRKTAAFICDEKGPVSVEEA